MKYLKSFFHLKGVRQALQAFRLKMEIIFQKLAWESEMHIS